MLQTLTKSSADWILDMELQRNPIASNKPSVSIGTKPLLNRLIDDNQERTNFFGVFANFLDVLQRDEKHVLRIVFY